MSAYEDALAMLVRADQSALRALETAAKSPTDAVAALVGTVVNVLVAQVHATLAVADAIRERPS